jgi:hypothetical protein
MRKRSLQAAGEFVGRVGVFVQMCKDRARFVAHNERNNDSQDQNSADESADQPVG